MQVLRIVLAISVSATVSGVHAQSYPTRPVTLVVPAPAGGPTDVIGRQVAQALASQLGQNVIVENRGGAGNTIGTDHVAKAKPDGYTLVVGSPSSHAIAPSIYPRLPYDPVKDFSPVIGLVTAPLALVIHPSVPASTLKQFIALAKAKPGQLNFGSGGSGTTSHLTGEYFNLAAVTRIVHVPYKGSGPATTDLMAGQIQMMFIGVHSSLPLMKTGKVRGLGVTSTKRSELAPELPTLSEAGLPGFHVNTWYGIFGPAGMPREIVERLNAALKTSLKDRAVRERLTAQGFDIVPTTPEEFALALKEEIDIWAKVVKQAGAKAD
ncbi:MAG: Bug family tripartite tricarboxylate transporter substrate binding protein [Rhodospirillaceae bacterium]